MGQETARQIMMFIVEQQTPTQTDIVNSIGISASSVNWHMKRLVAFGLIEEIKEGKYKRYQLQDRKVSSKYITTLMRNYYPVIWEKWSDRLIDIFLSISRNESLGVKVNRDDNNEGGKISLLLSSLLILPFSGLDLQTDLFDGVESAIEAIIGIFSLLLLALSILAYKRSGLKKIIFEAIAFSLFAVQLLLDSIEETFFFWKTPRLWISCHLQ